ncbi:MAG: class I SAM-dependent methyltransferase [Coxiellaceae bacterium]|nr:class I SAM-dependent methyltransferase [Coxiellaceae bacterium]
MDKQIIAMQRWYQAPPGDLVTALEREQLATILPNFFGQYALQMGGPPNLALLESSPIKQQFHVLPKVKCTDQLHSIEVDFTEMPFAPNSVDLVVIDHLLEFIESPRQLLSQVYQCLAPHGHLVVLGFAPWSLWGIHRWMHRRKGIPWSGHFWRSDKVEYWLREIGYGAMEKEYFCYQGPLNCTRSARVRTAVEMVGQFCWAGCGGIYSVVAQKQINTMTPIKASWWARKERPATTCAEPSARTGSMSSRT